MKRARCQCAAVPLPKCVVVELSEGQYEYARWVAAERSRIARERRRVECGEDIPEHADSVGACGEAAVADLLKPLGAVWTPIGRMYGGDVVVAGFGPVEVRSSRGKGRCGRLRLPLKPECDWNRPEVLAVQQENERVWHVCGWIWSVDGRRVGCLEWMKGAWWYMVPRRAFLSMDELGRLIQATQKSGGGT